MPLLMAATAVQPGSGNNRNGNKMQARPGQPGVDEIDQAIRASRGAFISTFVFSCIVNILMLTGPLYMLQVYDRVLTSSSIPTLVALSTIVFVLYAYYGFLEFVRSRILVRIGRRIEENMRVRTFDTVADLALRKQGNVGSQPLSDLATIRQYLAGPGPLAFLDMPWVPIYMLVVFLLHWVLGVASLFAAVAILAIAIMSEVLTRKPVQEASTLSNKASLMVEEARRNAEAMHALGMRDSIRNRWEKVQQEALDQQTRANDAGGGLSGLSRVVRLMVQSGMLGLGAYLAVYGEITPGGIIAGSIIMSRALAPVEQAVATWQQLLAYRKARERLKRVLAMSPPEIERMPLPKPAGLLEAENVTVIAPGSDKPILQGVSFRVEPGTGLGVIGPTGAGKSTLARALMGLIPLARGAVRLDGATHDQRSNEEFGRLMGYLPQEVQLFDGTVAENISRFDAKMDAEQVVNAAKMANVHDLVMRLPNGYDTQLGENGSRLSVGQRQRVALARALYGEPAVIIMDEPNSNLDAEGESALVNAIRLSLQRGASVVVIAHRPSALTAIKDIMVLSDGRVAALGPRDEILKKVMQRPPGQPQQQIPGPPLSVVPSN
jgi:PrtD family type I secretion system ABC transporter